jgi:hypothetical protein
MDLRIRSAAEIHKKLAKVIILVGKSSWKFRGRGITPTPIISIKIPTNNIITAAMAAFLFNRFIFIVASSFRTI